ncbi:MAG: hypothetical protein HZA54_03855 [Planctomycetes bacterium]|nr:hypothetical protein [Planctomycetota bacterium]
MLRSWLVPTLLVAALGAMAWAETPDSGKKVGEHLPAFNPRHEAGPDAGSTTCPV